MTTKLTPAEKTQLGFGLFDSPTDEQIAEARERKARELAEWKKHCKQIKPNLNAPDNWAH